MLWCASAFALADRSSPLDAAFHSPATTADLSIRPRGQVNAPGLHLRCDFKIYAQPVRCRTPAPVRLFVAFRGAFTARHPSPSPILKLPACFPASAPLQDLSILMARSARPSSRQLNLP